MADACTDLDVCPHCGGEVRFGRRQYHADEECVPEERPQPGLVGRMGESRWQSYSHAGSGPMTREAWQRMGEQLDRASERIREDIARMRRRPR